MEETAGSNKTYTSALPQDGLLSCHFVCAAGSVKERDKFLERFFSLKARRLYVSAKGVNRHGKKVF